MKKINEQNSMVKWENFLPKSGLRVLLVEADESTRQIIGALLRKCNYKVATAPDGLKAWEVLKSRPRNIDLILTEVELPSISGYALLTLIMEHEICKNIPVIMMSKYDSVSLVYKCMMRGAADFLVKSIRINELKNLWQHVWRRQSVSREGNGPRDGNVAQDKLEATAENNATTDHSSGSKMSARIREDCLNKGSDAQSSCGKLDLEAESSSMAEVDDYSQPKPVLSPLNELTVQERDNCGRSRVNLIAASYDMIVMSLMTNSPREAIDLIGAFDNHSNDNSWSHDRPNRHESSPYLDLSLTRCSPAAPEHKSSNENKMLNHSNASAFSLWSNYKTSNSNPTSGDQFSDSKHNVPEDCFLQYGRNVASIPVNPRKEVNQQINQNYSPAKYSPRISTSQPVFAQIHQKLESLEDQAHLSATGQCGGDEQTQGLISQRSLKREAALNRFRLKRKERCFDKKVRYESRKKLAEQRPRVKGQFVR